MYRDLADFIEKNSVSGPRAYVLTTLGIAVATALRLALTPILGESAPYALQVLVVLLSATLAGYGPGLFAVALAVGLGWFLIPPDNQLWPENLANQVTTGFAGAMITVVCATMRSALLTAAAVQREADFISREMHHRVKNLFAVVASMVTLSARDQPHAKDLLAGLRERIQALSDAHDVAICQTELVSIVDLLKRLIEPYRTVGTNDPRVRLEGEDLQLPYGCTTPLGLIVHELATNAVKHGAFASPEGWVRLSWERRGDTVDMHWQERGGRTDTAFADENRTGFGTLLVNASVAQLRGEIERTLTDEGLTMRLTFPVPKPHENNFPSHGSRDRHPAWLRSRSYLSALRASNKFSSKKPEIIDSRS